MLSKIVDLASLFGPCSSVVSIWNFLHYDCCNIEIPPKNIIFNNFQLLYSFYMLFCFPNSCLWRITRQCDRLTNRFCHLQTMYRDLALTPPDCRKMSCVSRRIDFPCIFNEIIASTCVQQEPVRLWRLRTWFMDCTLHKCFVIKWKLLLHNHWIPSKGGEETHSQVMCNCVSIPRDECPVKPIDFLYNEKLLSYPYN